MENGNEVRIDKEGNVSYPEIKKPDKLVKLGILCPMRGLVDGMFMQGYLKIFLHLMKFPNIVPIPIFSEDMPVDRARNSLLKEAIISDCDFALWIDSDIFISTDQLEHLLKTVQMEGYDIVSGIYYERAPPFNPVLRAEADFGKMKAVYEYPTDKLFYVDGIGMGCVAMKRKVMNDVFREHKGKPFYFDENASEDLNFCRNVRKAGYKIWVHPLVQCVHIGASVGQWHYLHQKFDEYSDVKELAKFLGEKPEVVLNKCFEAPFQFMKDWRAKFGAKEEPDLSEEELDDFYKNCDYRFDLTNFWMRSKQRRNTIFNMVSNKHKRVLDFGCGIGDYGITMLEDFPDTHVVFCDINKKNLEYLRDRIKRRGFTDRALITDDIRTINEDFDLIFCLDMLEHVKNPKKIVDFLRSRLRMDGLLIASVAGKHPLQPQHISEINISEHGFVALNAFGYIRADSELAKKYNDAVNKIKSV